ncbi:YkgJ family cysteine cluster protein [Dyella nitratireducens]|nr:YkgJ family cysteine cluster protein [Dyella nitratireducens]
MIQPSRHAKGKPHCTRCDAVCCRLVVVLEPGDNIPDHLTTHLPQGHRVMAHGDDGWCVALDRTHMNCGIYENRPAVCRRFFMGGPYCKAIRAEYAKQGPRSIEITLK